MSGTIVAIVVVVVVLVVVIAVGAVVAKQRRSQKLEQRFGPEYERELERTGDRREAERGLREREKQRDKLDIRPLDPAARDRYAEEWRRVQGRFVDAPEEAVRESDRLVAEVMRERGYPVDDFDRRASDVSVDHPEVAENYRAAHAIAQRTERGEATTEELRQATVHYRSLFEELLESRVDDHHGTRERPGAPGQAASGGGAPAGGAPAGGAPGGGAPGAPEGTHDRREEVR
jgi:hypothetical protein